MIVLFVGLAILLAGAYAFLIAFYLKGWRQTPEWKIPLDFEPSISVSIIVPARNEEQNIVDCLQSIIQQPYPQHLLEIIVVDDHSSDQTAQLVKNLNCPFVRLIRLSEVLENKEIISFKKKAIETGISHARGELILTTDADCVVAPGWLRAMVSFYEKTQAKFIAAPVNFHQEESKWERFQSLDFTGMMLITAASIHQNFMHLSNGANLAYPKAVFEAVKGFEGIDHLASGDDLLLMEKIAAKYPGELAFLKSRAAIVFSKAEPSLNHFFRQRLRWAGKSPAYRDKKIIMALGLVFLLCWAILLSFLLIPFWPQMVFVFLLLFFSKSIADYILLSRASAFFQRKDLMKNFWSAQLLHVLYIAIVGLAANFKKTYKWKGRKVR